MEAHTAEQIPAGGGWQYEPKWDGFRCLAFRDRNKVYLQSKNGQPLARYFPDVADSVATLPQQQFVVDGELAIAVGGALSFDELQLRLHPAASRVQKLAAAHPAVYIVFDLLAENGKSYLNLVLRERRQLLEKFAGSNLRHVRGIHLSPATNDYHVANDWFGRTGRDLDGIIAKRLDAAYASGERTAAVKIKQIRTADCVVGGFRYASGKRVIGSLLLGLYAEDGLLHHVGFISGFKASDRRALTQKFEWLRKPPGFTGNAPGGPSRWSTERTGEWEPVSPKVVVEVAYDHFTGGRFRHGTKLLRWRSDKTARHCTMDQVELREDKAIDLL
jgi:ATP-dependent DNA ligase